MIISDVALVFNMDMEKSLSLKEIEAISDCAFYDIISIAVKH